ncbi:MAG: SDR family oxidoreductase [Erysipelotrichaceae bacterium]|nr:SDR family oxidoreductase [Erysipelotrichaceae bacterium]
MRTVLVTGASGGIGKEFARQFAFRGYNLVLVARREEELKQIKKEFEEEYGIVTEYFACDLAKDPKAVYDFCKENGIEVSVLINNAGFGDYKAFVDADLDKMMNMIDLNDKALVALTHYFIKDMKDFGYGHIINVGSVASFMPGPYMAVYYASKAFVMSFSLALREELRNDNIKVSVLCPGPVASDFWNRAQGDRSLVGTSVFTRTPTDAAISGYSLFESGKAYKIDGKFNQLMIRAVRFLPLELAARAVGFVQKKVKGKAD